MLPSKYHSPQPPDFGWLPHSNQDDWDGPTRRIGAGVLLVVVLFLTLRITSWGNTVLLEDHDSVKILMDAQSLSSLPFSSADSTLNPDTTPFYPLNIAVAILAGLSPEFGARLVSFFYSCLVIAFLLGIGRLVASPLAVLTGLMILAFSPTLIPLSFSVLTEPTYTAVTYAGIWLFWLQYKNPTARSGALLGAIFALSFLTRTEGFLYLALIPLLQAVSFRTTRELPTQWRRPAIWLACFLLGFGVLAAPQIYIVSKTSGEFMLNGRQLWLKILKSEDGATYDEKIYGLHHSPSTINLTHVQKSPRTVSDTGASISPRKAARQVAREFQVLFDRQLGTLFGPIGLVSFGFGLFTLWQSSQKFDVFLILMFLGFSLVPPILHNVVMRHIVIIAPLVMLVEGIGIVGLARSLTLSTDIPSLRAGLVFLGAALIIGTQIFQLYTVVLHPPRWNGEYDPAALEEPSRILRELANDDPEGKGFVAARKRYLAYFSGYSSLALPYTDYGGLVRYLNLNGAEYLFLERHLIRDYPFLEGLDEKIRKDKSLSLLHRSTDSHVGVLELYRFVGRDLGE